MISPNVVMTAFLAANGPLLAALTPAGSSTPQLYSPRLAPNWKPIMGPAISHFVRGGPEPSLYTPTVQPSYQVTTWAATPKLARQVHSLAYAALHGAGPQSIATVDGTASIKWGKAETFPQDIVDPETGWFTVTSFFQLSLVSDLQS